MTLKIGALFAGYGGLDMAVMDTLDAKLAWYAEFDKAPAKVMAHHHPNVPNLWDVTKVDWSAVEPVDIITGGSPCQDLSHAGKRAGMTEGTRSNLWVAMREAIATIRPRLVVWENVRGAFSAPADSALEPCPGCVGDGDDGPVLRALGRVLGDLADLGYDCRWYGLRAADVGAAHGRFRVFLFAVPADADVSGLEGLADQAGAAPAGRHGHPVAGAGGHRVLGVDGEGLTLLPTPAVNDMGEGKDVDAWDAWTERMRAAHGNGNGHGKSLAIEAQRMLLPTPTVDDAGNVTRDSGAFQSLTRTAVSLLPTPSAEHRDRSTATATAKLDGSRDFRDLGSVAELNRWGDYAPAIARWEHVIGRPAPEPTETGAKGNPRLSPKFVEWLMGLPAGHVTDPAIGLTRNEQLKALGNGVVPPQAAAALRAYLRDELRAIA